MFFALNFLQTIIKQGIATGRLGDDEDIFADDVVLVYKSGNIFFGMPAVENFGF